MRPSPEYRYLLAFGSNLGDKRSHCQDGLLRLQEYAYLIASSTWITTEPLSLRGQKIVQPSYLNFVVDVASDLYPDELYMRIRAIEDAIGHPRDLKWASRQIDIDILFFAENRGEAFTRGRLLSWESEGNLCIPHREFWQRDFLQELVAKDLKIPLDFLRSGEFTPIFSSAQLLSEQRLP